MVSTPEMWDWGREIQIKLLKNRLGLKPSHYLLDFGCGVLRGGCPIISYLDSEHYYGIEKDLKRLNEGKLELKENNLEFKLPILGQDFSIVNKPIDIAWAWEVFIHLTDDILEQSIYYISQILKHNGFLHSTVKISDKNIADNQWLEYPVVFRSLEFYEKIAKKYNFHLTVDSKHLSEDNLYYNSRLTWTKIGVY